MKKLILVATIMFASICSFAQHETQLGGFGSSQSNGDGTSTLYCPGGYTICATVTYFRLGLYVIGLISSPYIPDGGRGYIVRVLFSPPNPQDPKRIPEGSVVYSKQQVPLQTPPQD